MKSIADFLRNDVLEVFGPDGEYWQPNGRDFSITGKRCLLQGLSAAAATSMSATNPNSYMYELAKTALFDSLRESAHTWNLARYNDTHTFEDVKSLILDAADRLDGRVPR